MSIFGEISFEYHRIDLDFILYNKLLMFTLILRLIQCSIIPIVVIYHDLQFSVVTSNLNL